MQSDRFAREIVGILALSDAARSRRLMRNPLGAGHHCVSYWDAQGLDTPALFAVQLPGV